MRMGVIEVDGRVALVTGASRNIGLAVAQDLAASGYRVVGVARDGSALAKAFASSGHADRLEAMACDLSDPAQCVDLARRVIDRYGSVDVLVHNAVHRATFPLTEIPFSEWRQSQAVIVDAAFLLIQQVVPGMIEAGWGRIVTVAGLSGQRGSRDRAAVISAKGALIGLTKAVAHDVGLHGITANVVSPGPIDTSRGEWTSTGAEDRVGSVYGRNATTLVGRRGTVEDIAAACRYLISDEAGFVTGQTLSVNGGLYMV